GRSSGGAPPGIVSRSSVAPWPPSGNGAHTAPSPFSGAHADQNEQPYAVSEAFVASSVCLQVASMVALADGFFAMSTQALRVWSICVLYIARCASGTLETTQASYLVRKSSQAVIPVLCAWAVVTPASKAMPAARDSSCRRFAREPATAFDVA